MRTSVVMALAPRGASRDQLAPRATRDQDARRAGLRLSHRARAGYTLIEMIVALLIVGAISGIAVMSVNSITSAKLKEEAGRLASVIRACYALAATNGRTYRIRFDLDAGSYTIESSESLVLVSAEREASVEGGRMEDKPNARAKVGQGILGLGGTTPRLPKPGWRRVNSSEIGLVEDGTKNAGTIKLPTDIEFEGVFTTHQIDVFTRGKADMHFFPQGWAERAIIYLREKNEKSEKGEVFTVEVDPLTGRAYVHPERLRIPAEDLSDPAREEEGDSVF